MELESEAEISRKISMVRVREEPKEFLPSGYTIKANLWLEERGFVGDDTLYVHRGDPESVLTYVAERLRDDILFRIVTREKHDELKRLRDLEAEHFKCRRYLEHGYF